MTDAARHRSSGFRNPPSAGFPMEHTMPIPAPSPEKGKRQPRAQFGSSSPTTGVQGAAELLSVHPKTVLGLIDDAAIPAAKVGRAYVMLVKDVLAYLEKMIVAQTSARMRAPTKARRQGQNRAGSRSASSSDGSCAR
ncbi:helix-turn-helix domain-containing protein [Achromobacter spanius]|uniref:helix-turn-helix domain-containing protein n=1 Tax=Achromobacter spanius TaxID=217203 RepID=UPI0036E093F4